MRALWRDRLVAEAPDDELISIEGNWYFPPGSVDRTLLVPSPTPYTCPWKGECSYWTLRADDAEAVDAAWSYQHPYADAFDRVGADFSGYMTFGADVTVVG